MSKYRSLTEYSKVFLKPNQQRADVEEAGNHALAILYGGTSGSDVNFERTSRFSGKVVSNSQYLPPERLPPTSDAGRFHSQRVYLQVQTWIGNDMNATEWGWTLNGSTLKPYRMEQGAAPSSLLKVIRCNCTGKCGNGRCSCRKNGLLCTLACGHCKGITCTNGEVPETTAPDENISSE